MKSFINNDVIQNRINARRAIILTEFITSLVLVLILSFILMVALAYIIINQI